MSPRTLDILLLRGRHFTKQESTTGAHVAVISEAAARLFWPGVIGSAGIFSSICISPGQLTGFEVVGVAKDVRFTNLTRIDPAHVYLAPDPTTTYPILFNAGANQQAALAAILEICEPS